MSLQSGGSPPEPGDELGREIHALAPWFHNLHLPDGRQTAPDHPLGDFPAFKWEQIAGVLPADMSGMRVLDIGCNAGFYSIALAQRGADVVAIDSDPHYLQQAQWARNRFGIGEHQLTLLEMPIYELARTPDTFDVVLFLGVLYHLRYPLLALDIVAEKVRGLLVLQTLTMPGEEIARTPPDLTLDDRDAMCAAGWPKMAFIEHRLEDDSTNWWAPNRACVLAMLRSSGLEPVASPGHEIEVARRTRPARVVDELSSVFG